MAGLHEQSRQHHLICSQSEDPNDFVVVACNFTPVVRQGYRLGVPKAGYYQEIFNSDSSFYAGSNVGNYPGCNAEWIGHHGRPASMLINLHRWPRWC